MSGKSVRERGSTPSRPSSARSSRSSRSALSGGRRSRPSSAHGKLSTSRDGKDSGVLATGAEFEGHSVGGMDMMERKEYTGARDGGASLTGEADHGASVYVDALDDQTYAALDAKLSALEAGARERKENE